MKVRLTEKEAQRLINSQRAEIATLNGKLAAIGKQVDRLVETKARLPEAFLRAAVDLAGHQVSERVNPDWLEEMQAIYRQTLDAREYDRKKLPVFGAPFLFAVLGTGDPVYMENVRFEFREILTTLKKPLPDFLT